MPILPRFLLLAALLLPATPALAQLREASCPDLLTWLRQAQAEAAPDLSLGWRELSSQGEVTLPGLFRAPATAATFGKPALEWLRDEARRLADTLRGCTRQRDMREHRDALGEGQRLAGQSLVPFASSRGRALEAVPRALEQLGQAPFAPRIVAFLAALPEADTPDGWQAAQQAQRGLTGTLRPPAQILLRERPYLLPEDAERLLLPEVRRQQAQRRGEAKAASLAALADLPPTPDGLARLMNLERGNLEEALHADDRAEVAAARQARRTELLAEIEAGIRRRIAQVPDALLGFGMLDAERRAPALQALPPETVQALRDSMTARGQQIAANLMNGVLSEMEAMPPSLPNLANQMQLRRNVVARLRPHAEPAALAGFETRATSHIASMANAAFPDLQAELAAAPVDPAALARLAPPPWVADLPEPAQARYMAAFAERRAALEAEIARLAAEEARREAGPLRGRHYANQDASVRLEFLDARRVLVTQSMANTTVAGTYEEIAGERVIITLPDSNMVLRRIGRRLDGGALVVERVPPP